MKDQQIEKEIHEKGLDKAPRISLDDIKKLMDRVLYTSQQPYGTTSTHVHGYLDGKFYLASGHSAAVSMENFDIDLGYRIAKDKAEAATKNKLWELEGYRLYAQLKEKQ